MTSSVCSFAFVFCNLLRRQRIWGSQSLPFGMLRLLLGGLGTGVISKEWLSCLSLFCRTPPSPATWLTRLFGHLTLSCHSLHHSCLLPSRSLTFLHLFFWATDNCIRFLVQDIFPSLKGCLETICLFIYLALSLSGLTLYSNFLNNYVARAALIILSANRIVYFMFESLSTDGFFSSFWVIGLDFFCMPNNFCLEFRDCVDFPVGSLLPSGTSIQAKLPPLSVSVKAVGELSTVASHTCSFASGQQVLWGSTAIY